MLTDLEVNALVTSLGVSSSAVALCFPLALALTVGLTQARQPLKSLLDILTHLPLVLPPVVMGYILLILLGTQSTVGAWLQRSFEVHLVFTQTGAIIATMVMTLPFQVRLLRSGLEPIPTEVFRSAAILGASPLQRFWTITLPLMRPSIIAALAASFAASLGQFGAIITFAANIPGETQTLPLALFTALQSPGGEAMASRLALLSIGLAIIGLVISEIFHTRARRMMG